MRSLGWAEQASGGPHTDPEEVPGRRKSRCKGPRPDTSLVVSAVWPCGHWSRGPEGREMEKGSRTAASQAAESLSWGATERWRPLLTENGRCGKATRRGPGRCSLAGGGGAGLILMGSLLDLLLGCGGGEGATRVWPELLGELVPVLRQKEHGFRLDTFVRLSRSRDSERRGRGRGWSGAGRERRQLHRSLEAVGGGWEDGAPKCEPEPAPPARRWLRRPQHSPL